VSTPAGVKPFLQQHVATETIAATVALISRTSARRSDSSLNDYDVKFTVQRSCNTRCYVDTGESGSRRTPLRTTCSPLSNAAVGAAMAETRHSQERIHEFQKEGRNSLSPFLVLLSPFPFLPCPLVSFRSTPTFRNFPAGSEYDAEPRPQKQIWHI